MSWQCGQGIVAEPTGATVSGASIAGGAKDHVDVAFRLIEWLWEENGPLVLVPRPREMMARAARSEVRRVFARRCAWQRSRLAARRRWSA